MCILRLAWSLPARNKLDQARKSARKSPMHAHAGTHLFERESLEYPFPSTAAVGWPHLTKPHFYQASLEQAICPCFHCKGRKPQYYLAFHLALHSSRIEQVRVPSCTHHLDAHCTLLSRYFEFCGMGFVSDLLYRNNPKRRETVQALADSIGSDIKFIEKATNDTIERINKFLKVKQEQVTARGKTINEFLLDVRQAFEQLGKNAEAQYRELSAKVDTELVERVRRKVQGLDLQKMREAIFELEIAGVTMGRAVAVVASLVTTEVTMHLEQTTWASASAVGGFVAGGVAGTLVFVIFEAISGAVERAGVERGIRELAKAEQTRHE